MFISILNHFSSFLNLYHISIGMTSSSINCYYISPLMDCLGQIIPWIILYDTHYTIFYFQLCDMYLCLLQFLVTGQSISYLPVFTFHIYLHHNHSGRMPSSFKYLLHLFIQLIIWNSCDFF